MKLRFAFARVALLTVVVAALFVISGCVKAIVFTNAPLVRPKDAVADNRLIGTWSLWSYDEHGKKSKAARLVIKPCAPSDHKPAGVLKVMDMGKPKTTVAFLVTKEVQGINYLSGWESNTGGNMPDYVFMKYQIEDNVVTMWIADGEKAKRLARKGFLTFARKPEPHDMTPLITRSSLEAYLNKYGEAGFFKWPDIIGRRTS